MATCTKAQYQKWNAQLPEGWRFDLHYFLLWGEKCPVRAIELPDGRTLRAKLFYTEEREGYRHTGRQIPQVNLSVWTDRGDGFASSTGMGYTETLGVIQKNKNYKHLCACAVTLSDADILTMAKEHMTALENVFIM